MQTNVPPLKNPPPADPGTNGASASSSAADPLEHVADVLDETANTGGKSEAPPPAAPVLSADTYRPAVRFAFRVVEAWAIERFGEELRASADQRNDIESAGCIAAAHYAPWLLSQPWAPLAFAFFAWSVPGIQASRARRRREAANAQEPTAGTRPARPAHARNPAPRATTEPNQSRRWDEGQGEIDLDAR
jgi:hypothetical protein